MSETDCCFCDVRPDVVKQLVKKLPDEFVHRVNYMRGK